MTPTYNLALEFQQKLLQSEMQRHIPGQEQASCSQTACQAYMAQRLREPSRGKHALEAVLAKHAGQGEHVINLHLERMRCRPAPFSSAVCCVGTPGCSEAHPSATVHSLLSAIDILSRAVPESF